MPTSNTRSPGKTYTLRNESWPPTIQHQIAVSYTWGWGEDERRDNHTAKREPLSALEDFYLTHARASEPPICDPALNLGGLIFRHRNRHIEKFQSP